MRRNPLAALALASAFTLSAAPAVADEISDPQMVFKIEKILYENGLLSHLDFPDGHISETTRNDLKLLQKTFGWPQDGKLSMRLYNKIIAVGYPDALTWGAVSIGEKSRRAFAVWNYDTREKAIRTVQKQCTDSSPDGKRCVVSSARAYKGKSDWAGAMKCTKRGGSIVSTAHGKSKAQVHTELAKKAKTAGYDQNRCAFYTIIAADGRHE